MRCCAARQTHALRCVRPPPSLSLLSVSPALAHACSCEMRIFFIFFFPPLPSSLFSLSGVRKRSFQMGARTAAPPASPAASQHGALPPAPSCPPPFFFFPPCSQGSSLVLSSKAQEAPDVCRSRAGSQHRCPPRTRCNPKPPQRELGALGAAKVIQSALILWAHTSRSSTLCLLQAPGQARV